MTKQIYLREIKVIFSNVGLVTILDFADVTAEENSILNSLYYDASEDMLDFINSTDFISRSSNWSSDRLYIKYSEGIALISDQYSDELIINMKIRDLHRIIEDFVKLGSKIYSLRYSVIRSTID